MATTKLIIRENKPNKKGECVIYVRYTHEQKSIQVSTGEKILPGYWDAENEKAKRSLRGYTTLNSAIEAKEDEVKEIANIAKSIGVDPTIEYVREKLSESKAPSSKKEPDFYALYKSWVEENKGRKVPGFLAQQLSTLNLIEEFEKEKGYKITLDRIDMAFYNKFTTWLMVEKERTANTVGKHIKHIKAFLNHLTHLGINQNLAFKSKSFKRLNTKTDIIYLTRKELDKLFDFDLSKDKRLDRIRDIFIFECATGLRYSDIQNLKPENIKEDYIEFTTIKTRDKLIIPLSKYAKHIIKKYDGQLPATITNQKMNKALKDLGKHCGIDSVEQRVTYTGSKRVEKNIPKHELLTTHCARRTFITQSLERGLRPEVIMKITGHKDLATMMRYVKITENTVKEEMLKAWA
ncbi:site-specific integrase [Pontibacter oryzae]|uniref:Site-specific integrase n=1 Tax=Pontibacter oryzae TaxID=2304593 RepID=A0A399SKF8_9BACT|nr:site-specific integrase [Pontibacter oryzae]RIJ42662.1 site-specific integrase [Pontibacter oryzae]